MSDYLLSHCPPVTLPTAHCRAVSTRTHADSPRPCHLHDHSPYTTPALFDTLMSTTPRPPCWPRSTPSRRHPHPHPQPVLTPHPQPSLHTHNPRSTPTTVTPHSQPSLHTHNRHSTPRPPCDTNFPTTHHPQASLLATLDELAAAPSRSAAATRIQAQIRGREGRRELGEMQVRLPHHLFHHSTPHTPHPIAKRDASAPRDSPNGSPGSAHRPPPAARSHRQPRAAHPPPATHPPPPTSPSQPNPTLTMCA